MTDTCDRSVKVIRMQIHNIAAAASKDEVDAGGRRDASERSE